MPKMLKQNIYGESKVGSAFINWENVAKLQHHWWVTVVEAMISRIVPCGQATAASKRIIKLNPICRSVAVLSTHEIWHHAYQAEGAHVFIEYI